MQIVPFTPDHLAAWEQHCSHSNDAWFWHTRTWHKWLSELLGSSILGDHSFMVVESYRIVAIAPCMAFMDPTLRSKSLGSNGYPVPWPAFSPSLTPRQRQEAERLIFAEYSRLASALGLNCIKHFGVVQAPSFYLSRFPPANLSVRYGYSGRVLDTHVIDLEDSLEDLWKSVRKGHKSSIKSGQKRFDIQAWHGSIADAEFQEYQTLHALAAGRVTRSQITFDMMREWIREGNGLLIGAREGNRWLGFVYIMLYGNGAYYASACNHPEGGDLPIGHPLLWEAIQRCKDIGIKVFEMGLQTYGSSKPRENDEKLVAISRFKRGFGGFTMPRYEAYLNTEPETSGGI